MLPNISAGSVMQDTLTCCQLLLINPPTRDNCYSVTNCNRPWPYTPPHDSSIAFSSLIANHNHSWLITNTNVWSFTDSIFRHSLLSDLLSYDKPCRKNGFYLYNVEALKLGYAEMYYCRCDWITSVRLHSYHVMVVYLVQLTSLTLWNTLPEDNGHSSNGEIS